MTNAYTFPTQEKSEEQHSQWKLTREQFSLAVIYLNGYEPAFKKFDKPSLSHRTFGTIFICNQIKGSAADPSAPAGPATLVAILSDQVLVKQCEEVGKEQTCY